MGGILGRLDLYRRVDGSLGLGVPGLKLLGLLMQVSPLLAVLLCAWLSWAGLRRASAGFAAPRGDRWLLSGLTLRTGLTGLALTLVALSPGYSRDAGWLALLWPFTAIAWIGSTWALAVVAGLGLARLRAANRPAGFASWALLLVPLTFCPVAAGAVAWIDLARAHSLWSLVDVLLRHPWAIWAFGAIAGWSLGIADRPPRWAWLAPGLFWAVMVGWQAAPGTRSSNAGLFLPQTIFPSLLVSAASGLLMVVLPRPWMRVVGTVLLLPVLGFGLLLAMMKGMR